MLLVLLLMAIAMYFIFTYHGVIQGHNPINVLKQMGGGDGKPHFKILSKGDVINNKAVLILTVFDENNKIVHVKNVTTGQEAKDYVAKLRSSGRNLYFAILAQEDKKEMEKKFNAFVEKSEANRKQTLELIFAYYDLMGDNVCGEYTPGKSKPPGKLPICNEFPTLIPTATEPAKRELKVILKELETLQKKPQVDPEHDIEQAIELADKLKEQDDAATKRVHQVRQERKELDEKLDEVKKDEVTAKELEANEKINTPASSSTSTLSIKNHIELTKKVLDNHNKRLEKLEGKLCGIGSEIRKGHAMLKSIKGKLDNDMKPETKHQRFRKSNKVANKRKLRKLEHQIKQDPKCPVCPMYSDTHPVNVLEVTNQGFGSIVKDKAAFNSFE